MKDLHIEIKKILKRKGITAKNLSDDLNMTESGFYAMLKNTSVKATTLEQISKILEVPVSYFFDEAAADEQAPAKNNIIINGGTNPQNNTINIKISEQQKEIENLKKEIEYLKQLLQQKDEIINLLKKNLE